MTKKLKKKDLEKYLPSTDSIADTSAPNSTMAAPSGSQLKEKMRKRLAKVPAEPLPHKQARVTRPPVPLDSAGGIQTSVATATAGNVPSSEVPFSMGMTDDGIWSSSEIGGTHLAKLRNEDKVAAARVLHQRALTLMKEVEQDLISDGVDKVIKESEEDKLINDLKRKLEVAHKAQDKLKKEVFDMKTKQEKWHIEKINLESALKEERDLRKSTCDLLKSTQVNLTEEKKKIEQVLSDKVLQYLEGFNCAKSQAAFLCSVDEGKLDAMRLSGEVRDGEIVVDDEGEESEGNDSRADGSSNDSDFEVDLNE